MQRSRLDALLTHVSLKTDDSREMSSIKQQVSITALRRSFTISPERLRELTMFMIHEMYQGLAGKPSTLKMLPTYVYRRDSAQVNGLHYALDLGGTNFRVIRMEIGRGELISSTSKKYRVSNEHMKGNAEGLFGFIADCVLEFAARDVMTTKSTGDIPIGFTFSFPLKQSAINNGVLLEWTKGFSTTGVVGEDVAKLLQKALHRGNSALAQRMKVVAMCNDTVGTLIGRYFKDPHACVGAIFGTGANVCYFERSQRCIMDKDACKHSDVTVVNTELGNFDSHGQFVLPITSYDQDIDNASANPGKQRFEKLISGMYIGEIARRVLIALSLNGSLPECFKVHLKEPYSFGSDVCSTISADRLPGLHLTGSLLLKNFNIECPSYADLRVVRDVCYMVIFRAAQLAGVALAAALMKSEAFGNATVAIDGSVFELTPYFKSILSETVNQLLPPHSDVRITLQKGGSGFGAGYIAGLAALPITSSKL